MGEPGTSEHSERPSLDEVEREIAALEREQPRRVAPLRRALEAWRRDRLFIENAAEVFWIVDRELRPVYVSASVEGFRGYTAEEVREQEPEQMYAPGSLAAAREALQRALEGDLVSDPSHRETVELEYLCKDGSTVWGESTVFWVNEADADPPALLCCGITRDVTERRRLEKRLRRQKDLSEAIIDTAPLVVLLLDTEGRIVRFNPYMERLGGWRLEEVRGRDWFETFLPENDRKSIREVFGRTRRGVDTTGSINPIVARDGSERLIEWYNHRLEESHCEVSGVLSVGLDVTDRERRRSRGARMQKRILQDQKLESLGVMAGGIAHDFNNILAAILGNADLAQSETEPGTTVHECVSEIKVASRRAAALCRHMLAFSGQGKFTLASLDLSELVRDMRGMLAVPLPPGVELALDLAGDLPTVQADDNQMRQLVLGLVFNAAEAIGDAKGTVTVSTSHVADGQELADAAPLHDEIPAGPCVVLRVEDDGEGMDPATVSRIFEPFFTTRFTGRGLGLAAALGIVRGHEGAIDVESAPGRGSTFTVYLPAETGERSADRTRRSGRDTSTSTVLVVDDEESVLRTTERMLHRLGYRVVLAATGEEALSQLGAHHSEIDAVLLDLELPDMDGVETFREIRLVSRGLPVIVSSGYSERTVEEQFRGGDIAGFIQKPYDMESLRRTLQELD